jgi:hypothetical protein
MTRDLIQKIIIMLSLEYLVFFSAEVILPGVITNIFNINILLLGILIFVGLLIILNSKGNNITDNVKKDKLNYRVYLALIIFLLFINMIALYKVSLIMMLVYTVVTTIVTKSLWSNR